MFTKLALAFAALLTTLTLTGSAVAGDVRGPRVAHSSLAAGSTDSYTFVFQGKERWYISVSGDGDTDLDCYVYDANGNLVSKDDDNTDECRMTDVAIWTGSFTVRVVNRGRVSNVYDLATN